MSRMSLYRAIGAFVLPATFSGCGDSMPTFPEFSEERVFDDHREVDIRFQNGDATLAGTLYLPRGAGPHPVVAIHPGSSWTVRSTWDDVAFVVSGVEVAAFSWDKRGQASSGGTCCPAELNAHFDLLAGDLVAAVRAVKDHGTPRRQTSPSPWLRSGVW